MNFAAHIVFRFIKPSKQNLNVLGAYKDCRETIRAFKFVTYIDG